MDAPVELPGGEQGSKQPSFKSKRSRPAFKKLLFPFLITLVAAAIAYGAWQYWQSRDKNKPAADITRQQQQTNQTDELATSDVPETSATETYKSDFPRLELAHPNTWTVTAADNGIRVESPELKYKTVGAGVLSGNFRLYIRQGAREIDSQYIGRGIAVLPSEKLAYSQPVTGQRPETSISFFGLDGQDHFAYLLIAGNFSLQPGETLGPGYGKEPETFIVVGGYSAKDLADDLATNKVPLDYFKTTNVYKQAMDIIRSLKLL